MIGGEEIRTGDTFDAVMPHDKEHVLAHVHKASPAEVDKAIAASAEAWEDWHRLPWEERAAVFLRAAELLSGPVALDACRRDDAEPVQDRRTRPRSTRPARRSTSGASTSSS